MNIVRKNIFIEYLCAFLVACVLSNFHNFIGVSFFGLESYNIPAGCTILLLCAYIVVNLDVLGSILKTVSAWVWIVFMFAFPVLTLLYAPMGVPLDAVRLLLFSLMVIYGMILVYKADYRVIGTIFGTALFITIVGGLLSQYFPSVLNSFAENRIQRKMGAMLGDFYVSAFGRAYGFYMQPNELASNTVIFLIGFLCFYTTKTSILKIGAVLASLFVVVLTASRGGIITFIGGMFIVFLYYIRHGMPIKTSKFTMGHINPLQCIAYFAVAAVTAFIIYMGTKQILFPTLGDSQLINKTNPIERIEKLLSGEDVISDSSVLSRYTLFMDYLSYSKNTIIFGEGYGGMSYLTMTNQFEGGAHNAFMLIIIEYGYLHFFLFAACIVWIWGRSLRHKTYDSPYPFAALATVLFLISMTNHNVLTMNSFNFTIGVLLGLLEIRKDYDIYVQ